MTDDSENKPQERSVKSIEAIRIGVQQAMCGQGRPMREFIEELAAKAGIDLHSKSRRVFPKD